TSISRPYSNVPSLVICLPRVVLPAMSSSCFPYTTLFRSDDGRILASSVPYYSLRLDCKAIPDTLFRKKVDSLSMMLSRFFKDARSEEHTSELQSRFDTVSRLLLEKKTRQKACV